MTIAWNIENDLPTDEFIDVLLRSGLAARRPVDERERIATMLENSNLIVTARDSDGMLIGVSRCVTDYAYCCYCSDLAVDRKWQRQGVGRELVRRSREAAGDGATFFLLSAPGVEDYYLHTGFEKFDSCFGMRRKH
jgi:predicted N-acetyltransferase YhbS